MQTAVSGRPSGLNDIAVSSDFQLQPSFPGVVRGAGEVAEGAVAHSTVANLLCRLQGAQRVVEPALLQWSPRGALASQQRQSHPTTTMHVTSRCAVVWCVLLSCQARLMQPRGTQGTTEPHVTSHTIRQMRSDCTCSECRRVLEHGYLTSQQPAPSCWIPRWHVADSEAGMSLCVHVPTHQSISHTRTHHEAVFVACSQPACKASPPALMHVLCLFQWRMGPWPWLRLTNY